MQNNTRLCCWCFLLTAAFFLISCAPVVKPLTIDDPETTQVWPKSPERPRIKLLRRLGGAEDLSNKKSRESRLFRWLTGEMAEKLPLIAPYGVVTDGEGVIWVADPGAHAVHRFDLSRRRADLLTNIAGVFFQTPSGLAFDRIRKRLYVADSGTRRVFMLSPKGELLAEIGSSEVFKRPAGLAVDSLGNLLVADVLQGLVLRFSPQGEKLSSFGSSVTVDGLFNRPLSVAVDAANRVYVVDSLNFRIEVLDSSGHGINTIGELGDVPGTFSRPRGVAVDSGGHVYVSDAAFDNIQVFDHSGRLLLVFGSGGQQGLSLPAGLFIDQKDRIYVADTYNHQLQIYQYLK